MQPGLDSDAEELVILSRTVLIVQKPEEIGYLQEHDPRIMRTGPVLTTTVQSYLEANRQGLSALFISDFLNENDWQEIKATADNLSRTWYLPFRGALRYRGIDLGELCRIDNVVFFREVLMANRMMERVSDMLIPQEVMIFRDLLTPCIGGNRYNAKHDIFEAVALGFAEACGISIKELSMDHAEGMGNAQMTANLSNPKPSLFSRLARKGMRGLFTIGTKTPADLQRHFESTVVQKDRKLCALCLVSGYDAFVIWPILRGLSETDKWQCLLVSKSKPTLNGADNRSGIKDDGTLTYIPLDWFKSERKPRRLVDYCRFLLGKRAFSHDVAAWTSKLEVPLNNRFLSVQYRHLWQSYFPAAIEMIDTVNVMFDAVKPDLVILEDMMSFQQRIMAKIARQRGIKSIGIPHGCINDIEEYEFESDLFLAWGDISKHQLLNEFRYEESRIRVVGSPIIERAKRDLDGLQKTPEIQRDRFSVDRDAKVVVILTGGFTSEVYGRLDVKAFLRAWKEIGTYASLHQELVFFVKPHPSHDYLAWCRSFFDQAGTHNVRFINNVRVESLLAIADAAVMHQVSSTAVLIALLAEVPLLFIRNAVDGRCEHPSNDWNAVNGLELVDDARDISGKLDRLLNDSEFRKFVVRRGKEFLADYVRNPNGDTLQRIVAECEGLARGGWVAPD